MPSIDQIIRIGQNSTLFVLSIQIVLIKNLDTKLNAKLLLTKAEKNCSEVYFHVKLSVQTGEFNLL